MLRVYPPDEAVVGTSCRGSQLGPRPENYSEDRVCAVLPGTGETRNEDHAEQHYRSRRQRESGRALRQYEPASDHRYHDMDAADDGGQSGTDQLDSDVPR